MALKVASAEKKGEHLYITIQGDTVSEVTAAGARKYAYDQRGEYGFENAGIEAAGGPFPVDMKHKGKDGEIGIIVPHEKMAEISKRPDDLKYRHTYRLTRGI